MCIALLDLRRQLLACDLWDVAGLVWDDVAILILEALPLDDRGAVDDRLPYLSHFVEHLLGCVCNASCGGFDRNHWFAMLLPQPLGCGSYFALCQLCG